MNKKFHTSVLLNESIDCLEIKKDGFYVDGTLGEGGHSKKIFNKLDSRGLLVSLDFDPDAIDFVENQYKVSQHPNWQLLCTNFSDIDDVCKAFNRKLDGLLLDLGFSSRQLETSGRGLSYNRGEEPLDMRLDMSQKVKAKDLMNALSEKQIRSLLLEFGEERYAKSIAQAIAENRERIQTVQDLVEVISKVVPAKHKESRWSAIRRVFQAFRIAVNSELDNLNEVLDKIPRCMNNGGVVAIITFHSLEDRIVKQRFLDWKKQQLGDVVTKKAITPSEKELEDNFRAHSAKLRCFKMK